MLSRFSSDSPIRKEVYMAIYHFTVKIGKRSHGNSSVGAAAYCAGIKLLDERTGRTDFKRRV